ncbi:MAG: endonuclease III [DPANN group archaeon]|nr:endonuclease III [DPANN group archaeon]
MKESFEAKKKRLKSILSSLKQEYGLTKTALTHSNVFELLVATMLSAQCTDKRVNIVTKDLFNKYSSIKDFIDVDLNELEQGIKSTGFYRTKAKNIKATSIMIYTDFDSCVPKHMNDLLKLPGVARKTANIVLSEGYGIIEGVAVDTHVRRISIRLGLTVYDDPVKIETDLLLLVPKNEWKNISNLLILHGRTICTARKPKCVLCKLNAICPSAFTFNI